VRSFQFGSPQPAMPPYQSGSSCNMEGTFVHYGWESNEDVPFEGGVFRPLVPFWFSGMDAGVGPVFGSFPGSDRVVRISAATGSPTGTSPRLFGKQTKTAIGSDRVYVGTAEHAEIAVFDLQGRELQSIRLPAVAVSLDRADIEALKERHLALEPPDEHAWVERRFAEHPFPETLPPYAMLLVDSEDYLWVQDYPRAILPTVGWTVFTPDGTPAAQVTLPTHFDVFEIGRAYILGRFLDPLEGIPQVHLYRYSRGG